MQSSHRDSPGSHAPTTLRRFCGPLADELHVLCRPSDVEADARSQAKSAWEAVAAALRAHGATADALVTQTVFLRSIGEDFQAVRDARTSAFAAAGLRADAAVATTFIGQTPLRDGACVEIAAVALLPRGATAPAAREIVRSPGCPCEACSTGLRAKFLRLGDEVHLHAGNVYGRGRDAAQQCFEMFCQAEALLKDAGLDFRDVIRTWIHLRDIDGDYDALNRARREFFTSRGIERRPASTCVQGVLQGDTHVASLGIYALKSPSPVDAPPMSTPTLNEAWTYGADFSRGLRVADANKISLHVSGTASIDENGSTVHAGDFAAQAERMLRNIETLLDEQGAGFGDLVSAVAYLKRPSDAAALGRIFCERGFEGFPCAVVEAPLCRPELLCETEAVALLPRRGDG